MLIKTTPRKLIRDRFGRRPLGTAAVREAVDAMMRRGWLPNYVPRAFEWDRNLVFIPHSHAFAGIYRCLDADGCGVVPRGLIESRTSIRIENVMTGIWLARYGLAIVALDGGNVMLRGTSSGMANIVNLSRRDIYDTVTSRVLVRCATGLDWPTEQLNEDLRLRATLAFHEFQVDVPGLLNGGEESDVRSRWVFAGARPAAPPPIADEKTSFGPDEPPF